MSTDPGQRPSGTDALDRQLAAYRTQIEELQDELAETNRGVVALSLELDVYHQHLEELVEERTAQLKATQVELQQTNSELLMLTAELDERIAERTGALTRANAALVAQIAEVERAREQVRRSTERLELATEAAGLGVWEWDIDTGDLVWDETTHRIFGVARGEFPDPLAARRSRLHPEDRPEVDLVLGSPLLDAPRFSTQFRIVLPDGGERVLSTTGLVVADADGSPVRVVGMDQDITERVLAAEELERYQSQLQDLVAERTAQLRDATERANAANLAKSAFLANMSHELRTPLNAILGFADLMRTGSPDPAQQVEYLDIIARSGSHLLALINDVLDMSKIESGRIELDLATVDVAALARDVVELMRDRADQKGLGLTLDIDPGVPTAIRGDEVKLRQILLNLVGNAVKCTQAGHVTMSVTVDTPEPGTHVLAATVTDTGSGIDPADIDRIFQPFQQAGRSTGGTGLGLPISRSYAKLMGGTLSVDSTLGVGSEFRLRVPVEPATAEVEVAEHGDGVVVGLEPGVSVRALIVEDRPENALLLRTMMERVGVATAVAENGAVGVELFGTFAPDLVWMDRRMPVMDGLEATRAIRAAPGGAHVVIVGVTASVFAEHQSVFAAAGMDAVITKPFRSEEIYDCMEHHLGIRFVRDRPAADELPGPARIRPADLAALPPDLQAALADALVLLEPDGIEAALGQVDAVDPALGARLRTLADDLQYQPILDALDELGTAGSG